MIKLLFIAGLIALACRVVLGKWPWAYLQGKPTRGQAVLQARKLLRVGSGASRAEILEAHRRRIAVVHPDRGGSSEAVHEANAARDLLLGELRELN